MATALDSTFLQLLRMTERASPSKVALIFQMTRTSQTSIASKPSRHMLGRAENAREDAARVAVVVAPRVVAEVVVVIMGAADAAVIGTAAVAAADGTDSL